MRQIDNMTPEELETLRLKGMLSMGIEHKQRDKTRCQLFQTRIDACDTLLDYLHDDVPWRDQQPLKDMLAQLKRDFESGNGGRDQ